MIESLLLISYCTGFLLDLCPRIATNGHTDCVLNDNLFSCALHNLTWQPYLPIYDSLKVSSSATLSSSSFYNATLIWTIFSILASSLENNSQGIPLFSDLFWHIWSVIIMRIKQRLCGSFLVQCFIYNYFSPLLLFRFCVAWIISSCIETVSYLYLSISTGLAHNWNSIRIKKKVLYKMRDI